MNLVIDIGNTRTKAAVFSPYELIEDFIITGALKNCIGSIILEYPGIHNVIVSTVKEPDLKFYNEIKKSLTGTFIELNSQTPIPVTNLYHSPETLGNDRLAAVVGAYTMHKGSNVLVIDAGTAVTYDFINQKGEYRGGNISPGMDMRFKALNQFTNKLPKYSASDTFAEIGVNTETAIVSGVVRGILYELEGYISNFSKNFKDLKIIITGGDANFFVKNLKKTIFVIPNLVLLGLNNILQYNEKFD